MTGNRQDGSETALSHDYWIKTMDHYRDNRDATEATKDLALMVRNLIEINKNNPETIGYLTTRAKEALK